MCHDVLTPETASALLASLGHPADAVELDLRRRDEKWIVTLPNGVLAWFAASPAGLAAIRTERRVLRLLESRCGFAAPRVIAESPGGDADVRVPVPGIHDADAVYRRVRGDPAAAARVGEAVGAMLAEAHTRVAARDVAGWLPRRPAWPEPRARVRECLPRVVDDPALCAAADGVMARYEDALDATEDEDRALVHTDLGLHNLGIDPASLRVHGIFDWESACWADRHLDFRYLTFDGPGDALLDAAIAAYEPRVGRRLSRARIHLYHAACAVGYLAFRDGVPPETSWCGRTLAEDLAWTRHAIARASAAVDG